MVLAEKHFVAIITKTDFKPVSLKPLNFYQLAPSKFEEDIRLSDFLQLLTDSNDPRVISLKAPLIVPAFLYQVQEEDGRLHQAKIDYAPPADYHRQNNRVVITPLEARFEEGCFMQVEAGDFRRKFEVKRGKPTTTELDIECMASLRKSGGRIVLSQPSGDYLLEQVHFATRFDKRETRQLILLPYLSLKSILEPESGLERLISDIRSGDFYLGRQRKKIEKLLDIIRAATFEEEEKIIESLILHDFDLYQQVDKQVFNETLLHYMQPTELQKILGQADDELLSQVFHFSGRDQQRFRRFISKNRFAGLVKPAQPSVKEGEEKNVLWQYIEDQLRASRESLVGIAWRPAYLFKENEPENAKETRLPEEYSNSYLSINSTLQLLSVRDQHCFIQLQQGFALLQVVCEVRKGYFKIFNFKHLVTGILQFEYLDSMPLKAFMAGLTFDNKLVEGFSIRLAPFQNHRDR